MKRRLHDVQIDYCGFNQNRQRFTCREPKCGGATIVVQPWMTNADWRKKYDEFTKEHPNNLIKLVPRGDVS